MKTIFCSGALGDTIVIAGAVAVLARRYGGIRYACLPSYEKTVRSLFAASPVEIVVVSVEEIPNLLKEIKEEDLLRVNTSGLDECPPRLQEESWATWMYRQLDIPFEERWNSCPIEEASYLVEQADWPPGVPLLHDDRERGFAISKFPFYPFRFGRVRNDGRSILQYSRAIESAPEIHVIDSAFMHLVESLQPSGKLFYHRYARFYLPVWYDIPLRHEWTIIDDEDLASRAKAWHILTCNLQLYPDRLMLRTTP
jgi:hypothetical protein